MDQKLAPGPTGTTRIVMSGTVVTGRGSTFAVTECIDEIWICVNGKVYDVPLDKAFEIADMIKRAAARCESLNEAVKEANSKCPTNMQVLGVD